MNARRAASTEWFTSSAPPAGKHPMRFPVAGSIASIHPPPAASRHWPSMSMRAGFERND
jgi:hypothetical protein